MNDISYVWLIFLAPVIGQCVNTCLHIMWNHASKGGSHLGSIILCFLLGFMTQLVLTFYVLIGAAPDLVEWAGVFVINSATFAGFGYCYFTFVNLLRASLRIRIVSELYEENTHSMELDALHSRYDANNVATVRFERLLKWGQIERRDDRLYSAGNAFYILGLFLQFLKSLMGIVVSEEASVNVMKMLAELYKRPAIRWWIVGILFLFAGLSISYVLIDIFHFPVPVGTLLSLLLGAILRFFAIDCWVFKETEGSVWHRFVKYQLTHAMSYALGWAMINGIVLLGLNYLIATVLATVITTLLTMFSHFRWVWKN